MSADDDDHFLTPFLQKRLPELGLDYDTYGNYLQAESLTDESEWDDVLELLRASSETHSDDEQVWKDLQREIEKLTEEHQQAKLEKDEQAKKAQHDLEHERLQQEIALAQEQKRLDEEAAANATPLDDQKRALVERYAYEEEDDEENGETGEQEEKELTNREVAAQALAAKAQQLRNQATTSKKDERQKTKQATEAKAQLKEERRKRATKGERHR